MIDILLRVNAEESRPQLGVSDLQSNRASSRYESGGMLMGWNGLNCGRCQAAVTCILSHIWRPNVVFATGTLASVNAVHVNGRATSAVTTDRMFRASDVCDHVPDIVSLLWADRPPL